MLRTLRGCSSSLYCGCPILVENDIAQTRSTYIHGHLQAEIVHQNFAVSYNHLSMLLGMILFLNIYNIN